MRSITRILAFFALLPGVAISLAASDTWTHYGGDSGGRRFVANSLIHAGNVDRLQLAWQFRTGDATSGAEFVGKPSSFKATPILYDGKLIFSTGFNRVIALDAGSGRLVWQFDPKLDFSFSYSEMFTSRGVAAWTDREVSENQECAGRVFLGTLDAQLIAIDARDGTRCENFGDNGAVDLSAGIKRFRRGEYALTSPPTVVNNVVVVGSSIGDNGAVELESGVVRGYDARDGRLLWRWNPLSASESEIRAGAANVWSIMSSDPRRNLVFLPTTSPSPDFYGGARPGDNRDANSIVALNVQNGSPRWQFQTVHHDLWDYDIASQPLLTDIVHGGKHTPVVLQATKMGHVFVLRTEDGTPYFPVVEKPVPQSDVPGEAASSTQPFPMTPPPLHDHTVKVWEYSPNHADYCRNLLQGVRYEGIFTPPSTAGTLLFPGNGGGTNWGSMAVDPTRQIAVLAVNRMPTVVKLVPRSEFDRRRREEGGGSLEVQFTAQNGAPFGMARHGLHNPESGLPCIEGPWGELVAIDLSTGQIRWRVPLGGFPGLADHPRASRWGSPASGGPMMTSTGLIFVASRHASQLQAFRSDDGKMVWTGHLPAQPAATPMSYVIDKMQYVVIAAGGAVAGSDTPGDFLTAFILRQGTERGGEK